MATHESNGTSEVLNLSPTELDAVHKFVTELSQENAFGDGYHVSQEEAVRFLMARKFDVSRALSLYHYNLTIQKKFGLEELNPFEEPLKTELYCGKFTVLAGKDECGATICVFTAYLHVPAESNHVTVLKSLVFQLDEVMKCDDAQRNGLTFLYNMMGSGYQNFDFELAMKVLHLLRGAYPARLKHVYVVMPPIWFRASLAILSSFLRDKIRNRITLIRSLPELAVQIPASILPTNLGGSASQNHKGWIDLCIKNWSGHCAKRGSHLLSDSLVTETTDQFSNVNTLPSLSLLAERSACGHPPSSVIESSSQQDASPSMDRDGEVPPQSKDEETTPQVQADEKNLKSHDGEVPPEPQDWETTPQLHDGVIPTQSGAGEMPSQFLQEGSASLSQDGDLPSKRQDGEILHVVSNDGELSKSVTPRKPSRASTPSGATDVDLSVEPLSDKVPMKPPRRALPQPPPEEPLPVEQLSATSSSLQGDRVVEPADEAPGSIQPGQGRTLDELVKYLKLVGKAGVHQEYELIRSLPPTGTFEKTLWQANLRKNRYNNILCFEETRVKLNILPEDYYSDYINANYVDGYMQERKFICTQGPTPNTFFDFWRMVWEQQVLVIVMITKCLERGRVKCGQYWPEHGGQTSHYAYISVTNNGDEVEDDYTVTELLLLNTLEDVSRTVVHIQFTSWPDFGVLPSAAPVLDVLEVIKHFQNERRVRSHEDRNSDMQLSASGEYEALNPDYESDSEKESCSDLTDDPGRVPQTRNDHAKSGAVVSDSALESCVPDGQVRQVDADNDLANGTTVSHEVSISGLVDEHVLPAADFVHSSGEYATYAQSSTQPPRAPPSEGGAAPPIVVHCSAGVGRTGTFCCLSNSVDRFDETGTVDIFSAVNSIRDQRAFSVQTPDQYEFCYTGLIEYAIMRRTESGLSVVDLEKILYEFASTRLPSEGE